jgi:hypothetical protein
LQRIRTALDHKLEAFSSIREPLIYVHPPDQNSSAAETYSIEDRSPSNINTGPFSLQNDASVNAATLSYEEWLLDNMKRVEEIGNLKVDQMKLECLALAAALEEAFLEVESRKVSEWERQRIGLSASPLMNKDLQEGIRRVDTCTWASKTASRKR